MGDGVALQAAIDRHRPGAGRHAAEGATVSTLAKWIAIGLLVGPSVAMLTIGTYLAWREIRRRRQEAKIRALYKAPPW